MAKKTNGSVLMHVQRYAELLSGRRRKPCLQNPLSTRRLPLYLVDAALLWISWWGRVHPNCAQNYFEYRYSLDFSDQYCWGLSCQALWLIHYMGRSDKKETVPAIMRVAQFSGGALDIKVLLFSGLGNFRRYSRQKLQNLL